MTLKTNQTTCRPDPRGSQKRVQNVIKYQIKLHLKILHEYLFVSSHQNTLELIVFIGE